MKSIDLSNFDTSQVVDMGYMFYNCSSLNTINLSSFDTSLVTQMDGMFSACYKLNYMNLFNFRETVLSSCSNMFNNVPNGIIICMNEANIKEKILTLLQEIASLTSVQIILICQKNVIIKEKMKIIIKKK